MAHVAQQAYAELSNDTTGAGGRRDRDSDPFAAERDYLDWQENHQAGDCNPCYSWWSVATTVVAGISALGVFVVGKR